MCEVSSLSGVAALLYNSYYDLQATVTSNRDKRPAVTSMTLQKYSIVKILKYFFGGCVNGSYLSMALHQHNITDDEGLHVAAGVYKMGRAEGAGGTVHRLERRTMSNTHITISEKTNTSFVFIL